MQDAHLESVRHFLNSQNPLMLVLGNKGSGKTELLNETVKVTRISRQVIRLQGSEKIQPSQLAQLLAKHWAVTILNTQSKLENQLEDIYNGLALHDQHCVLVVDDAHLLSFTVMAAITHLAIIQEEKKVHLHILLSGQNKLCDKIQNLQTKQLPSIRLKYQSSSSILLSEHPKETITNEATNNTTNKKTKPDVWQVWKKYGVSTFSIIALVGASFFIQWFDKKPHEFLLTDKSVWNRAIAHRPKKLKLPATHKLNKILKSNKSEIA